jgi:hypothetical protein
MYKYYLADKRCTEITVEDPSDDFQQMKDVLDIKLIWQAKFFRSIRKLHSSKTSKINAASTSRSQASSKKSTRTAATVFVNRDNFDQLVLDQEEI